VFLENCVGKRKKKFNFTDELEMQELSSEILSLVRKYFPFLLAMNDGDMRMIFARETLPT